MGTPLVDTQNEDLGDKSFSLKTQLLLLKLVAIWPLDTNSVTIKLLMRILLAFSSVCLAFCSVVLLIQVFKTDDLVGRSEAIDIFTLTLSAMYKQLFFVAHHDELSRLAEDSKKLIFPKGWMKYAPYLACIHCGVGCVAFTFWCFCPVIEVLLEYVSFNEMRLPMNIYEWEPLVGWKFVTIYAYCVFGVFSGCHSYLAIDGFLFSLIHAANGSLKNLEDNITSLRNVQGKDAIITDKMRMEKLKDYVRAHGFTLNFLSRLEVQFRSIIVVDVLHAIVSLSFAMFQLSESKNAMGWIKSTVFIFYCFFHQYLNSFFGQALIDRQVSLQLILEDTPWEEGSRAISTSTIMMMLAGMKPIRLSAWRVFFLQYETFAEFVKNMISTYMVLRQLLENSQEIDVISAAPADLGTDVEIGMHLQY